MKKFVLPIIILLMVLTSACGTKTEEKPQTTHTEIEEKDSTVPESAEDNKESEKTEETPEEIKEEKEEIQNHGTLNTAYLVDLGCSPEQITALRGSIAEAIWDDGPWYRFEESDLWYAFDSYDFDDENGSYIPQGMCTNILMNMNKLITGADEYSAETLESLGRTQLVGEYNEFYESNVYTISCDGYLLTVIADSKGQINGNTPVNIRR